MVLGLAVTDYADAGLLSTRLRFRSVAISQMDKPRSTEGAAARFENEANPKAEGCQCITGLSKYSSAIVPAAGIPAQGQTESRRDLHWSKPDVLR
jgi:hypothetical protein